MLDGRNAEIYTTLWQLSDHATEPCACRYASSASLKPYLVPGRTVSVVTTELGGKRLLRISIERVPVPSRAHHPDLAEATVAELVSLAHERGHERSERFGTYIATSTADHSSALTEERRAWKTARTMLALVGFDEWNVFDEIEAQAIASYEARPA